MNTKGQTHISIVVPVFNEVEAIAGLHANIVDVLEGFQKPFEIIFVNDGSTDGTDDALEKLSPLTAITFRKNFGQTAALDAGIKEAQGKYIAMLDGDGQNDPRDIPRLIEKLEEDNLDVVSGWRKDRHDPFLKKISSRSAAFVRKLLIDDGIHDSGCTLKVYKRECFEHVDLYGEMHRFIPALLTIQGFKIGELPVAHHARTTGVTKYNWRRGIKGILDMVGVWFWKKYSSRPLHLFGTSGIAMVVLGVVLGAVVAYRKVFLGFDISNTALTTLSAFVFLVGLQLVVVGLLADILIKNYFASTKDRPYIIRDTVVYGGEQ